MKTIQTQTAALPNGWTNTTIGNLASALQSQCVMSRMEALKEADRLIETYRPNTQAGDEGASDDPASSFTDTMALKTA